MNDNQRLEQLLAQILDAQREHLQEYKRVTSQSLELQRSGVETQNRHVRLYRRVLAISAVIIAALVGYAVWLSRLIPQ
jgi:hypothetical protein